MMKRLCDLVFTTAIIALATGRMSAGDPPAADQADPEQVFRKTCERFVALAGTRTGPAGPVGGAAAKPGGSVTRTQIRGTIASSIGALTGD
jgi:hypothetical protein